MLLLLKCLLSFYAQEKLLERDNEKSCGRNFSFYYIGNHVIEIHVITYYYSIQRYCFKIAGAGQLPSQLPLPLNKQIS